MTVIVRSHEDRDPEDKRKTVVVYEHSVEIFDKPEEERVIFVITGPPAFEGSTQTLSLTMQQEEIAALKEKQLWENETGKTIFRFNRDPLAGGMKAVRPPTEQLYRSGIKRQENFAVPPNGQFKPNPETGERVHAISQGKVGPEILDANGRPQVFPSNIRPGNATMVATPGWVGEYLA